MPQPRLVVRIAGVLCLVGASLGMLGLHLTWFDISSARPLLPRGRSEIASVLGVDIYQLPHPSTSWNVTAIYIGIAGLAVAGLVAWVRTPNRISTYLGPTLVIAVASGSMAFGAAATSAWVGPFPLSIRGPFSIEFLSSGPGAVVTLAGAGCGAVAVLLVLSCWAMVARPGPRAARNPFDRGPLHDLEGAS
jgi:hypothetical protein